jgi:integrase
MSGDGARAMLDAGVGAPTVARAYVLLKAILNTAADDELMRRNPCRIKGAGADHSPERQVISVRDIFALAAAIDCRYRALVLLAAFGSLRWGELAALRRADLDLSARTVKVERSLSELAGGGRSLGPPKSAAGRRTVAIPEIIIRDVAHHLATYVAPGTEALIFASPSSEPLHHGTFRRRAWLPTTEAAGLPGVHLHDLRHAGNDLSAKAGANLRELMERMGHSSTRVALIYLHGGSERQQVIAQAVDDLARAALRADGDAR